MVLIEWDTVEKQHQLLETLQKDGVGIPNNLVVENTIRFSIEKRYPVVRLRFFSTDVEEQTSPLYVFVVEENKSTHRRGCNIFARPPTRGHDRPLLAKAFAELIQKFEDHLEKHGEMRIRSDTITRDVLRDTDVFDLSYLATTAVFYLTDEQMEIVQKAGALQKRDHYPYFELTPSPMEAPVIEGFHADTVDLEKDSGRIHENWEQKECMETTKDYLRYLPSTVIRDTSTGEAVSWNMNSPFGQAINQFTVPEFRGQGLSRLSELYHGKQLGSEGLRAFKYVQIQNSTVVAAARRHPLFTMWEEKMENNVASDEEKRETTYCPLQHTIIRKKKYNNHL